MADQKSKSVEDELAECRATNDRLRSLLRYMVSAVEFDAESSDRIPCDYWDTYHASRMMIGQADKDWDSDAAGRGIEEADSGPPSDNGFVHIEGGV